jgi:carbonic anhydrase/acetyltransferase-like protein (isoleucine patch superfamily)
MSCDPTSPTLPDYWPAPNLSNATFVAANATIIGQVEVGRGVSIWYGAILRGDVERISVGAFSNIQDGAVLHGDLGQPTVLEDYVTVGHRAVIHSAYIERGCLIGIGAILLNGVRVGAGSMIGAGAVVSKSVPPATVCLGVPAKPIREVSEAEAKTLIEHAQKYEKLASVHANRGRDLGFT